MNYRSTSKLVFAAASGLVFSALPAHAQLFLNVSQKATFGPFVGGMNNNVTNNGSTNLNQVITTGTSANGPFSIIYDPQTGPAVVNVFTDTLTTTQLTFNSTLAPANFFGSLAMKIETDFDGDSLIDVTQNYSINLSPFVSPNGFTGVAYEIVPIEFFGFVELFGDEYIYASAVSNNTGVLLDDSITQSAIQFQFIGTAPISPVPEPSTFGLVGVVGLLGMAAFRRRGGASRSSGHLPMGA